MDKNTAPQDNTRVQYGTSTRPFPDGSYSNRRREEGADYDAYEPPRDDLPEPGTRFDRRTSENSIDAAI